MAENLTVRLPDGSPLELEPRCERRRCGGRDRAATRPGRARDQGRRRAPRPLGAAARRRRDRDRDEEEQGRRGRGRALADPPRRRARDGDRGRRPLAGDEGLDRPAVADGFYYDFEFPDGERPSEDDLERIEAAMREHVAADEPFEREDVAVDAMRSSASAPRPALQGRADRGPRPRPGRRRRLALPKRPLHRPLRGPARALDRPDQGVQAELDRRRLLARRREPDDADPDLRDRVSLAEASSTSTWRCSRRRARTTTASSARSSTSSSCAPRRRGCRSGCRRAPCCCG